MNGGYRSIVYRTNTKLLTSAYFVKDAVKYALKINQHNVKPHLDIEKDIQDKKNGLFTFNLRVSQGNIEDYAKFETVTVTRYREIILAAFQEPESA